MAGTFLSYGFGSVYPSIVFILAVILYRFIYVPLVVCSLRLIPGPKIFAVTKWRLAIADYQGIRTPLIHSLHSKFGTAIRIGPNEVSFSSLSALRTIYGAGSGFERTTFYRMFDVYGRQNLFTFAGTKQHAGRKKILAHSYSKSMILSPIGIAKPLIERNVKGYLNLLEREKDIAEELFQSLHWYSLDNITGFLYGDRHGGTRALDGNESHRRLLSDIFDSRRRKLSWYMVHFRTYTTWLYSRTGRLESILDRMGLLPMRKPTAYTGLKVHAMQAFNSFTSTTPESPDFTTIVESLSQRRKAGKEPCLDKLDIASELADHFDAGVDTTSDSTMFAVWALSRPENRKYQEKLIKEISKVSSSSCNTDGIPTVETADRLSYLDAILKETLRLYAPLPASEPRSLPVDTSIDGYLIPGGTVVSISPYTLHRNPDVFTNPFKFDPERWLDENNDLAEMKKWFWAFSSGGRMCIGLHLAMAEMTTLLAAIYKSFTTSEHKNQDGANPGVSSRFELFRDETVSSCKEHECWIKFEKRTI